MFTCKHSNNKIDKDLMHSRGQYFTKNMWLQRRVYDLIQNNPESILEPSMGRGDLVRYILDKLPNICFDLYEIDKSIELLDGIENVNYGDFLDIDIDKKYNTIIGNPPYVKTTTGNLYLDFIEKCISLLEEGGELIFIVPSDFMKITGSGKLIQRMMLEGSFTDFVFPHNEHLFDHASVDVMVFRYCRRLDEIGNIRSVRVSRGMDVIKREDTYLVNTDGILTFSDNIIQDRVCLSDYFDIGVGIVSGKESIYKNSELGNIEVLNGKGRRDEYILIDEYPCEDERINSYLLSHKETLLKRKIRKFNSSNWYQWGALRNMGLVKKNRGRCCIYMSNMTRRREVCFMDQVDYFGGGLIIMIPKSDFDLNPILDYLNSEAYKNNYMYSGRFKIGHKQLSNSLIDRTYFL